MRHTRLSMRLREREEPRNVSFMLIPAGAALRLTTMLSLLISPADVVVTSCWYTCRPNLVAQGLRLSEVYTVKRSSSLYAACTGGGTDGRTDGRGWRGVRGRDIGGVAVVRGGDRGGNQYGPQRKHGAAVVLTSNRRIATGRLPRVHCLLYCSV